MQRNIPCTVKKTAPVDTPTTVPTPGFPPLLKRICAATAKNLAPLGPSSDPSPSKRTQAGTTKRPAPVDSPTSIATSDLAPPAKRMWTEAPDIDADTMKKREKDFERKIRIAVSKAKDNMGMSF
jgi:hypothetical protein